MANAIIKKIVDAGFDNNLPVYLQRKVQLTNIVTLLLLFVIAVPFTFISLIYFPKLVVLPIGGILVCTGILIINFWGGIYYSRLLVSVLPITLSALYNAYLSGASDSPIPSVYLIELSFLLIPFIIFDLEEKTFLVTTTLFCAIVVATFPVTKTWFETDVDSSVLREGWLSALATVLAILCAVASVWTLSFLNKRAEQNGQALLEEMDEKNKNLEHSSVQLQENLKKLEEAQENEKKRSWITKGVSLAMETIRTYQNSPEIYDKIVSQTVNYLKANQAGLYIVDEADEMNGETLIKLVACYAYSRKKHITQAYHPGQGLLGQTYLEKEYIFLTEIPQSYIKIRSGLGDATPNSLLLMPLKVNEKIEGIIEIASFNVFQPYEIEFVEKLGESIASFIQTHKVNERTRLLLNESIKQAEALRAQEEELHQNLEELASTQEELHRKEKEYLNKIRQLEEKLSQSNNSSLALKE